MAVPRFALLVPVKPGAEAKSRLAYDEPVRAALRDAFVRDTVAAAAMSALVEVYVVGDGSAVPDVAALPDEGEGDLNRALARAAARVAAPHLGVAVLLGDLPCLRVEDLDVALSCAAGRFFVADADGTGTTLLAAAPGALLAPAFGAGSACRHATSGAVSVSHPLASLRRDIDTADDLAVAITLGVGRHTQQVLGSL